MREADRKCSFCNANVGQIERREGLYSDATTVTVQASSTGMRVIIVNSDLGTSAG